MKCSSDLVKSANENHIHGAPMGYALHPYATSGGDQSGYPHASTGHHHFPTLGGMGEIKSVLPPGHHLDASGAGGLAYQQGQSAAINQENAVKKIKSTDQFESYFW